MEGILRHLAHLGHTIQTTPDDRTDIVLTTYRCEEPLGWRQALLFTMRRRFGLQHTPLLFTLAHLTVDAFRGFMSRLDVALSKETPDPADWVFEGMAPEAGRVLVEQGCRGGPILALERILQAQAKSIRLLLLLADDAPRAVYHFDLVGAHPRSDAAHGEAFYEDIALRIATVGSTFEVTKYETVGPPVSRALWQRTSTPAAMCAAGLALGERHFFTPMIRIADLTAVPAVSDAIAHQYSEGCFATWDPHLQALISTVTGSARPVDKGRLKESDLAVLVGVAPKGRGALVRPVEGLRSAPPSSEAVEMVYMDVALPSVAWHGHQAPVIRSKLHGHRGIAAYDPRHVEFAPLAAAYYHYPVSCGTAAQVRGIAEAFASATALCEPDDPRQVVFTVLPGHGSVIVEKWALGKAPLQTIWEYMDAGYLEIARLIPQGPLRYDLGRDGRCHIQDGSAPDPFWP
jgi:hypothetical protein